MATDTLPDMDVPAKIIGSPGLDSTGIFHTIPMQIIEGHYKGQLFDVTQSVDSLVQFFPYGPGDTFICAIRNGTAKFKVHYAASHNTQR